MCWILIYNLINLFHWQGRKLGRRKKVERTLCCVYNLSYESYLSSAFSLLVIISHHRSKKPQEQSFSAGWEKKHSCFSSGILYFSIIIWPLFHCRVVSATGPLALTSGRFRCWWPAGFDGLVKHRPSHHKLDNLAGSRSRTLGIYLEAWVSDVFDLMQHEKKSVTTAFPQIYERRTVTIDYSLTAAERKITVVILQQHDEPTISCWKRPIILLIDDDEQVTDIPLANRSYLFRLLRCLHSTFLLSKTFKSKSFLNLKTLPK